MTKTTTIERQASMVENAGVRAAKKSLSRGDVQTAVTMLIAADTMATAIRAQDS